MSDKEKELLAMARQWKARADRAYESGAREMGDRYARQANELYELARDIVEKRGDDEFFNRQGGRRHLRLVK